MGVVFLGVLNVPSPSPRFPARTLWFPPPRRGLKLTRREVFRRDNFTCQYCGKHALDLTIDHVVPRHLGGKHVWDNVVTACAACNHRKGGRTLEESGLRLHRIPIEPPNSIQYIFGRHVDGNAEWNQFLSGW